MFETISSKRELMDAALALQSSAEGQLAQPPSSGPQQVILGSGPEWKGWVVQ